MVCTKQRGRLARCAGWLPGCRARRLRMRACRPPSVRARISHQASAAQGQRRRRARSRTGSRPATKSSPSSCPATSGASSAPTACRRRASYDVATRAISPGVGISTRSVAPLARRAADRLADETDAGPGVDVGGEVAGRRERRPPISRTTVVRLASSCIAPATRVRRVVAAVVEAGIDDDVANGGPRCEPEQPARYRPGLVVVIRWRGTPRGRLHRSSATATAPGSGATSAATAPGVRSAARTEPTAANDGAVRGSSDSVRRRRT